MAMLKILFVFCVLSVSLKKAWAVSSEDINKIHATIIPHIKACHEEFGVTEGEIKKAKETETLTSLEYCVFACVLKRTKLFNDQGLFDVDKAEELSKTYLSDEADQKKSLELISTCKSVNERDVTDGEKGCDRAEFLFECVKPFKDSFIN